MATITAEVKSGGPTLDERVLDILIHDMPNRPPFHFVFYIAASPEKVWEGFVSREANRIIFTGADLDGEFRPGASVSWVGPGPDGKRMTYVRAEVLEYDPPKRLVYTFATGNSDKKSRVTVQLVPESEATQVTVTHDDWADDDPGYANGADGWPRILSRLKTLIETGKTFRPH
jgi:uncharacterized protein YndB with AHSA1/START domain